jgi:hypothetical protein
LVDEDAPEGGPHLSTLHRILKNAPDPEIHVSRMAVELTKLLPGTNVMIFKIFSPKILAKKLAF